MPNNSYEILAQYNAKVNEQIFEKAVDHNLKILELKMDQLSVEDVFIISLNDHYRFVKLYSYFSI